MTTSADQQELMLRLQSQFGDMDLTNLLKDDGPKDTSESEESSLAEPSPEELRAWQEAQFKKGKAQVEAKKEATKSVVQRRREELAKGEDDWEALPSLPDLQGQSSAFFPTVDNEGTEFVGVHPLLQQLSAADEILGTKWKRLFSSTHGDGLSFGNLWRRVETYPGPTVMLVGAVPSASKALSKKPSTAASTTLGFFSTSPWSACESPDCFLFAFDDDQQEIQFFRPRRPDQTQQYMHCISSSQATNVPVSEGGIFIGGAPRVHLTESLEECRAMDYCSQFEAGDLLLGSAKDSLNYFDVTQIEVWAVGGEEWILESLQEQLKHNAIGDANRLRAQKVDKQQFLQDFQTGLLSTRGNSGGLFAHHYQYNTERCDM